MKANIGRNGKIFWMNCRLARLRTRYQRRQRALILKVLFLVAFFTGCGVLKQTTPRTTILGIRYLEPFVGYIKNDIEISPNIDMTPRRHGCHISRLDRMLIQGIYIDLSTETAFYYAWSIEAHSKGLCRGWVPADAVTRDKSSLLESSDSHQETKKDTFNPPMRLPARPNNEKIPIAKSVDPLRRQRKMELTRFGGNPSSCCMNEENGGSQCPGPVLRMRQSSGSRWWSWYELSARHKN